MNNEDTKYMQVALKLAQKGIGSVEPNPAVGCVIVKQNQVIGKSFHKKFGGPHAEINALEDCKNLAVSPQNSTIYITLEPCCHHGKTGPCTEAIIKAKPARVVVAMLDPFEHANGQGIEKLRQAGIEVVTGICEDQAKLLNAPFIKFAQTGKTWVILKWAQSIDGKLAYVQSGHGTRDTGHESRWISSEKSRKDVHKLRQRVEAILVGIGTVLADDPLLTARPARGKKLTRIVLDSNLRIPLDCQLLKTAKRQPVLIVTSEQAVASNPQKKQRIEKKGAEILTFPEVHGKINLNFLLDELSKRKIAQLLVEGGPTVISSFLKEKLADEICIYIAPKILASQGNMNISEPMAQLTQAIDLHHVDIKNFDGDTRIRSLFN